MDTDNPSDMDIGLEKLERLKRQVEMAIDMIKDGMYFEMHDLEYGSPIPEGRMDVGDFIIIDRFSVPKFSDWK